MEMVSRVGTITCFLCGGLHLYPGPRFEAHLINEHGALFNTDFLVEVSLYKGKHSALPTLGKSLVDNVDIGIQTTEEDLPKNAHEGESGVGSNFSIEMHEDASTLLEGEVKKEPAEEDISHFEVEEETISFDIENNSETGRVCADPVDEKRIPVWICPVCPQYFKKMSLIKQHMCIAHEVQADDYIPITSVDMTEKELQERIKNEKVKKVKRVNPAKGAPQPGMSNSETRRAVGAEWEPNSFSSRFTCYFCGEQYRKDYKLKLHLMMKHKNQPADLMTVAKEELIKSKLDGCVHKCGLCGNKYNSIANFTRHIKDVHNITRSQYKVEYGDSEVISRMFTCELCQKEVKHTRNIIGSHMKMVHLISWKEYQDIVLKLKNGEESVDLPSPELFDCSICGVSVKYKREHLNKKHQIDEEVYEDIVERKDRGENIADQLPDREIYTCNICERECMDLKRHLQSCHKLTEEVYRKEFLLGEEPVKKILKQEVTEQRDNPKIKAILSPPSDKIAKRNSEENDASKNTSKVCKEGEVLSTDLQCYFNCAEVFKKDYQLYLHLKLKHRNENPEELKKAYAAASDEIALTRRTGSLFSCALCPRVFHDNGAFYGHVQNKHLVSYREYKDKYGRCETESRPFECNICSKVIKHERNTIHTHLKMVHGINWSSYLGRIRRIRQGLAPDPLPTLKTVECLVCHVSVKYLREHLRNAHKISEQEYEELFEDDSSYKSDRKRKAPPADKSKDSEDLTKLKRTKLDLTVARPESSEIKNKDNKRCSVCETQYLTRKEFIEHCQLVHGMKFKTKSGVRLPPPEIKVEPRHLEQNTDGPERGEAHKNRSFQTSDGFEIEIEGYRCKEEMDADYSGQYCQTVLSKWNRCLYQCAICSNTTNTRPTIMDHILSDHGLGQKAYLDRYPDPEISKEWFLCRICNARVKFMKDPVSVHLKSHGSDLQAYETSLMMDEDWPYHPDHQPFNDASRRSSVESEEWQESEGEQESNPVDCDSNMNDREENRTTSPLQWNCLICAEVTLHSPFSISSHLTEAHSITLDKYRVTYGDPLLEDEVGWMTAKNSKQVTSTIWNKCVFRCPVCGKKTSEKKIIRRHTVEEHSVELEQLEKEHGDSEVYTEYFRCEICSSEVKHLYKNISMHLKQIHNMTPAIYQTEYNITSTGKAQAKSKKKQGTTVIRRRDMGPFSCLICGKKFSSKSNRSRHIRDFCSIRENAKLTLKDSNKCPVSGCEDSFERSLQLKKHLTNVHKIFPDISVKLRETDRQAAEVRIVDIEDQEPPVAVKGSTEVKVEDQVLELVSEEVKAKELKVVPDSTTGEEVDQTEVVETGSPQTLLGVIVNESSCE